MTVVLFLLTTPRAETTVISVSLATLSMRLRTCAACSSAADSRLVRILRQLCIRFCKPADARQRLVEVGPDILKLDHQLVDVADQLFRPRIAQDFFDAFRNVEDIRGYVVIRQRRERLQDVVELRRDGGNLGHVVVFFDFLDRIMGSGFWGRNPSRS